METGRQSVTDLALVKECTSDGNFMTVPNSYTFITALYHRAVTEFANQISLKFNWKIGFSDAFPDI